MTINATTRRLGTCLRPLSQISRGYRQYSTGPSNWRGNVAIKTLASKLQTTARPIKNAQYIQQRAFAAAIAACAIAYWFFNAICHFIGISSTKEEAADLLEVSDENDLYEDFQAKIDARQCTIVDVNNKKFDFGSYFHGYGKGLVKGMNLNFRKITLDNGTKGVELSFRVNHVFHEQLEQIVDGLYHLNPDEQQAFASRLQAQGIKIYRKTGYTVDKLLIRKKSAHLVVLAGVGSLMIGKDSCYNLKDQVKVTLDGNATLESFHEFLSLFGLQNALKKSTNEDIERLKIGVLFKTFYPKQAYYLDYDESFFTLPIDRLKQKIIDTTPEMKEIFAHHTVEKHELFPGYVRYGVAVDKDVYALGGRALTTALTSTNFYSLNLDQFGVSFHNEAAELPTKQVAFAIDILKNGLFSKELRDKNGMNAKGLNGSYHYKVGGAQSVYSMLLTDKDLDERKKIGSIGYSDNASVRLYISLKALNQGSYQYNEDMCGTKEVEDYINRPNIFDFVKRVKIEQDNEYQTPEPYEDDLHYETQEIMIPDRIDQKHFMGMTVKTEQVKQQIISRMRDCNLLQKDQDGIERYNGIPVVEFISTEDRITPELLKRCHSN